MVFGVDDLVIPGFKPPVLLSTLTLFALRKLTKGSPLPDGLLVAAANRLCCRFRLQNFAMSSAVVEDGAGDGAGGVGAGNN